jgi:TetR/AcrR family transcriptional regulator
MPSSERQEDILDRTLELAASTGLAELTMKKIAARVGFSEAAIYRHFPTKQALLLALMARLETRLVRRVEAIAAETGAAPAERIGRILEHHLSLVLEKNSLPIMLLAEASASGDPVLLRRMRGIMQRYVGILQRLVKEGMDRGELPAAAQPETVAMLLLGIPAGMAIEHRLIANRRLERGVAAEIVPFTLQLLDSGRTRR